MRIALSLLAAAALSGCASTYQLQLMPRDSGKLYTGVAHDSGSGEGSMSITIEAYLPAQAGTAANKATASATDAFRIQDTGKIVFIRDGILFQSTYKDRLRVRCGTYPIFNPRHP